MKNLGSAITCMACMCNIETGQNYVKHHVTYFPETIINVHTRCHGLIHRSNTYPKLVPDLRQSFRWSRKRKQLYWTWQPYVSDYRWLNFMDSVENGFLTEERKERIMMQMIMKAVKD